LKNGIVFCDIKVDNKTFERQVAAQKISWPYNIANWIDSTQDISNFLLVFNEPHKNAEKRRIDQTVDEFLPQLRDSPLAKLCKVIIPFAEYNSRRSNLPSAVTILSVNPFEILARENLSTRKKSGFQSDHEKEDENTNMRMENEWKRVNANARFFIIGCCTECKCCVR